MWALIKSGAHILFLSVLTLVLTQLHAQSDTTKPVVDTLRPGKDSVKNYIPSDSLPVVARPMSNMAKVDSIMKHHSPKKAALRSALIPGWGQVYNKRWWKVPIIYIALGISGSVFIYNLKNYKDLRVAYKGKYLATTGDSVLYWQIRPDLLPIDMNALRSYRDEFRRNIDFSVLAFVVLWGLNVVDATVDAHLRPFDVSPELTMQFKFGHSPMARTNGVSLIFALK